MKYILEIEIQGLPPMSNAHLRQHWAVNRSRSRTWKRKVLEAVHGRRPIAPLTTALLTLTRCSSNEPDTDGCRSGFKSVIDGLVEAQVLVNDKPSNIGTPDIRWEKAPKGQGKIKIRVEQTNHKEIK